MNLTALIDPTGAAIVLGGTMAATVLGSGRRELAACAAALVQVLQRRRFVFESARAEIAADVAAARTDGVLRSGPFRSSDDEIAHATQALVHDRSPAALLREHERFRRQRMARREAAQRPLLLAGEMAPVFGMAGTLLSLSQLQMAGPEQGALMGGVALAIVTTLYGMLLAHLVCNPLARLIARRGAREEDERQRLIDWLAAQLAPACPPPAATLGQAA